MSNMNNNLIEKNKNIIINFFKEDMFSFNDITEVLKLVNNCDNLETLESIIEYLEECYEDEMWYPDDYIDNVLKYLKTN